MAKLITFTQGDAGMIITANILDENKKPLQIGYSDKIKGHLQYPNGTCIDMLDECVTIINRDEAKIRITIAPEYAEMDGFYQIFIQVLTDTYRITATKSIDYYVNAKHNIGAH